MSTHLRADFRIGEENAPPWRTVFMGTPACVIPALDALAASPETAPAVVYTPPDRRRGRGRKPELAPVKQRALELGIPVAQPETFRDAEAVAQLASERPDIIVVAAYGRLLPPDVLALPRLGCLNLHPSLLPRHRGPAPVAGAILAGDDATGVTVMLLDAGMDTGPIIAQRERPIGPQDDAETLTAQLFRDGADLLTEVIPQWAAGGIAAIAQDGGRATYTAKIERADGAADWGRPADELARRQRAYAPWPGLYTQWEGKELKLLRVAAIAGAAAPGLVVSNGDGGVAVGAGGGLLAVHRLQLEGRRAADAGDFLRGYPGLVGAMLG